MSNPQASDIINKIIAEDAQSVPQTDKNSVRSLFVAEQSALYNQQIEALKEEIKDIQHYRDLRKKYADRVFVFMCIWCGMVFSILIINTIAPEYFHADTSVLCTLIGGTTVSVIGLVGFMMQGLFHTNGTNHKKS